MNEMLQKSESTDMSDEIRRRGDTRLSTKKRKRVINDRRSHFVAQEE